MPDVGVPRNLDLLQREHDHNSAYSLLRDQLHALPEEITSYKSTPDRVKQHVPFTEHKAVFSNPTTPSASVLDVCGDESLLMGRVLNGLSAAKIDEILGALTTGGPNNGPIDLTKVAKSSYFLKKVEELRCLKMTPKEVTLKQKNKKDGRERPDVTVAYFDPLDALVYIVQNLGTDGWRWTSRDGEPYVNAWDGSGVKVWEGALRGHIDGGARLIMLDFYIDDFRRDSKRTNKTNGLYMRIANDENDNRLIPIAFAPSSVPVDSLMKHIISPSARILTKGIRIGDQKYIGGFCRGIADHMGKVDILCQKGPSATIPGVYDVRRNDEQGLQVDFLYKQRDLHLQEVAMNVLQWCSDQVDKNTPLPPFYRQLVSRIRELFGLLDGTSYPAVYTMEVFAAHVPQRMGICYMHTETRGVLELHSIAVLTELDKVPHLGYLAALNSLIKLASRYPHRPLFKHDVITTKTHHFSQEKGLHLSLATAEQYDHYICLLLAYLRALLPSDRQHTLDGLEAHIQYSFILTHPDGVDRAKMDELGRKIQEAKKDMIVLLGEQEVCRPKFASLDYWQALIEFSGGPMSFDTTPFEAYHQEWKAACNLTNGHDVERQLLSYAASKLMWDWKVPPRVRAPRAPQEVDEIPPSIDEIDQPDSTAVWKKCGARRTKQTIVGGESREVYEKGRFSGYIVQKGHYVLFEVQAEDRVPQRVPYQFLELYVTTSVRNKQTIELSLRCLEFVALEGAEDSRCKKVTLRASETLKAGQLRPVERLDIHDICGSLYLAPYVRRPHRYPLKQ